MPKPKYVPKHRDEPVKPARSTAGRGALRKGALMTGVAVAATGVAVSAGVLSESAPHDAALALSAAAPATTPLTAKELAAREIASSRGSVDRHAQADKVDKSDAIKKVVLSGTTGRAFSGTENLSSADPRTLTRALMPQYGLLPSQFDCIDSIWTQESNWNVHADNPTSSAYGIPQALPGSKMASAGPDWQNSAETQIRWGLGYIKARYGSACSAWAFKSAHGFY